MNENEISKNLIEYGNSVIEIHKTMIAGVSETNEDFKELLVNIDQKQYANLSNSIFFH